MKRALLIFTFMAALAFAFGCAKKSKPSRPVTASTGQKYYAVTSESAAFFNYGPQQANGPNRQLPKNTVVTMVTPAFGYSRVKLATGEEGYVSTADIRSATPSLVAAAFPTPTPTPLPAEPLPAVESTTTTAEPTPTPSPSISPY
jgi:hypothetical protein